MKKERCIEIKIDSLEKLNKFNSIANKFTKDINVWYGHQVFDGKSILHIYSICANTLIAEIVTDNKEVVKQFKKDMEEFAV